MPHSQQPNKLSHLSHGGLIPFKRKGQTPSEPLETDFKSAKLSTYFSENKGTPDTVFARDASLSPVKEELPPAHIKASAASLNQSFFSYNDSVESLMKIDKHYNPNSNDERISPDIYELTTRATHSPKETASRPLPYSPICRDSRHITRTREDRQEALISFSQLFPNNSHLGPTQQ